MVSVPLWLLVLVCVLAVVGLLDRILVPSARWYLRRRVNAVIDQVNRHLDIRIRPFQLTKRRVLLQRLMFDAEVMKALESYAVEKDLPRDLVQQRVKTYAMEIIPAFNAYLYYRFGYWVAKKVVRWLYDVRASLVDDEAIARVNTESTIVFVMNHRSNMDYILVSFLASQRTTLSYAVGEWARIWPLQSLIKAMGAYFVRRNSGDPLYRKVLERYIAMATREGVCQAMFPEGGLTRDGRIRPPKLGLFDYMLRNFDHRRDRDILFVPVGINYDRTLEDRTLLRALDPQAQGRSRSFVVRKTLSFVFHNLNLMVRHKWKNFGNAAVAFGSPISAAEFARHRDIVFSDMQRDQRFEIVKMLSDQVMDSVARVTPVLPLSAVSAALLEQDGADQAHIKSAALRIIDRATSCGAPCPISAAGLDAALEEALSMLRLRRLISLDHGQVQLSPENRPVVAYYANAIAHLTAKDPANSQPQLQNQDSGHDPELRASGGRTAFGGNAHASSRSPSSNSQIDDLGLNQTPDP